MLFGSENKMTWPWCSFYNLLLLQSLFLQIHIVHACDEECKLDLIEKFETLLDSKLNSKFSEIETLLDSKLNSKISEINLELGNIKSDLNLLRGTVAGIHTSTEGFDGRTSIIQVATENMKWQQEMMSSNLNQLISEIGTLSSDLKELRNDVKDIKTEQGTIADDVKNINITVRYFEDRLSDIGSLTSNVFDGLDYDIQILSNSTSSSIQDWKSSQEKISNTIHDVNRKVESLEDQLNKMEGLNSDSFKELNYELTNISTNISRVIHHEITVIKQKSENQSNIITSQTNSLLQTTEGLKGLLQDVESLKPSMVILEKNITMDIDKVEENLFTKLDTMFNSMEKSISSTVETFRCTDGFLVSTQCYRFFRDQKRTWSNAKSICESHGYILAEPSDSDALGLRRYILDHFGDEDFWLGGRGSGSYMRWQSNNQIISKSNPLWHESFFDVSTTNCLELDCTSLTTYHSHFCTSSKYVLCQKKS